MALNQHITLGFYSVLTLLMGLALGMNPCQEAVDSLFVQLHKNINRPVFILHYYFTPGQDLLAILASLKDLGSDYLPESQRNKNEAVMANPVGIATEGDFSSVNFTVKHNGATGTGKIACRENECGREINTLKDYWNEEAKSLACFEMDPPRISVKNYGIEVFLPWTNKPYEIIRANYVLEKLIEAQSYVLQDWSTTLATFQPDKITFFRPVAEIELGPFREHFHWDAATFEYIKASVNLFNDQGKEYYFRRFPVKENPDTGTVESQVRSPSPRRV